MWTYESKIYLNWNIKAEGWKRTNEFMMKSFLPENFFDFQLWNYFGI